MSIKEQTQSDGGTQDSPSVFKINSTCQYMENHRPSAIISADSPLDTAITSEGQPIVFSIDDAGNLMATVTTDGAPQQGWAMYNISAQVMQSYVSPQQACGLAFSISQDTGSSMCDSSSSGLTPIDISIVFTVTVTNTLNDDVSADVWVLPSVSCESNAAWLTNPTGWVKQPTTGTGLTGAIKIQDTRSLRFNSSTADYSPLQPMGVVHVQGADQLLPFLVPMSGAGAWEALNVECAYNTLISAAVGRTAFSETNGLYKIIIPVGQSDPVTSFTSNASDAATEFETASPTALATVPSSYEDQLATDLLVADGADLVYYACDGKGATPSSPVPGVIVLTSPLLQGCSELHCSTDGNVISVYGLANGVIFHTQADYNSRGESGGWSTPLPLLANVSKAAIHISEERGLTSIFAVQAQGSASVYQQNGLTPSVPSCPSETNLVEMHKDHLTNSGNNHWRKRLLHLPDDTNFLTLQTYTHYLQFVDQYANPAANTPVLITAETTVVLEVNNQCVTVTAASGATVMTDLRGCLEVLQEAPSPAVTQLTFTATTLPGSPSIPIDPTVQTRADLNTYVNAPASNPKAVVNQSWGSGATSSDLSTAQGYVTTVTQITLPWYAMEIRGGLGENEVEAFFGDIWQAICEDLADIGSLVIKVENDIVTIAINVGTWVYQAALNTMEDVCAALSAIAQFLGAALEDLFQWLAFLFDWEQIIANQASIYTLQSQMVTSMPDLAGGIMTKVADWLDYYATKLEPGFSSKLPANSMNQKNGNAQSQTSNSPTGVSSTDPRMSWGQSQVQAPGGSGQSAQSAVQNTADDSKPEAGNSSSSDLGQAIDDFVVEIGSDMQQLISSDITIQQFGTNLENDALSLLANVLTAGADSITEAESDVVSGMSDWLGPLTAPIEVPLFSTLFQEATKTTANPAGEQLTLLGLIALLEAVPITFIYGLVGTQPTTFLDASTLSQLVSVIQDLDSYVPGPSQSAVREKKDLGVSFDVGAVISMMYVLTIARAVRGVTTYLLGQAEEEYNTVAITAAMRLDNTVWVFEGVSELLLATAIDYCGETVDSSIDYLMGSMNTAFAVASLANTWSSNTQSSQLEAMAAFSMVVGGIEIGVALLAGLNEIDTQENFDLVAGFNYGCNEFFEIFQNKWDTSASLILKGRLVFIGLSVISDAISATMLLTGTGTGDDSPGPLRA